MMPNNVLSPVAIVDAFIAPRSAKQDDLVDFDLGPVALSDPSQGLMVKSWKGNYANGNVYYSASDIAPTIVDTVAGIQELSITFDQNGHPCYSASTGPTTAFIYWYNPVDAAFEKFNLPSGSKYPRVALDDKRAFNVSNSDVLCMYLLGGNLCMRMQRDRWTVEYPLHTVSGDAYLSQIGMNVQNRFQILLEKPGLVS